MFGQGREICRGIRCLIYGSVEYLILIGRRCRDDVCLFNILLKEAALCRSIRLVEVPQKFHKKVTNCVSISLYTV